MLLWMRIYDRLNTSGLFCLRTFITCCHHFTRLHIEVLHLHVPEVLYFENAIKLERNYLEHFSPTWWKLNTPKIICKEKYEEKDSTRFYSLYLIIEMKIQCNALGRDFCVTNIYLFPSKETFSRDDVLLYFSVGLLYYISSQLWSEEWYGIKRFSIIRVRNLRTKFVGPTIFSQVYVYIHIYIQTDRYTYTQANMHTNTHTYMWVYVRVCVCMCICMYSCMRASVIVMHISIRND